MIKRLGAFIFSTVAIALFILWAYWFLFLTRGVSLF